MEKNDRPSPAVKFVSLTILGLGIGEFARIILFKAFRKRKPK